MGLIDSIKQIFSTTKTTKRGFPIIPSFGSSVAINSSTALTFAAVWSAVKLLSESVSTLPISVYKKDINGDKVEDTSNPLYNIIKYKPNNYQSSITFFEKIMMDLCLNGNSYIYIERNNAGRPIQLKCLDYNRVKVIQKDNYLFYSTSQTGDTYDADDVLHFKLITQDGILGLSPISQCKNALGWNASLEEFGNTFFKNGAKLSGLLSTERSLSEEAISRLKNSFNNSYAQLSGSNQTAVLEEGLKFAPVSISPDQAQFLSSRTFSISEIARIFNIPPHMLKDLSKSSFNNIEMQSQEFVTYTLQPYLARIEQEMNLKLFRYSELGKQFVEFNVMGLLRGNVKDRSEYYKTAINNGWMTINEVRRKENMNGIQEGNEHYMQLNMTTLKNIGGDAS